MSAVWNKSVEEPVLCGCRSDFVERIQALDYSMMCLSTSSVNAWKSPDHSRKAINTNKPWKNQVDPPGSGMDRRHKQLNLLRALWQLRQSIQKDRGIFSVASEFCFLLGKTGNTVVIIFFPLSVINLTSNVTEDGKSTRGTSVWGDVSSGNQLSPGRVFEN